MTLTLQREFSTNKSTPGKLYIDGVFECCTLEDVVREKPGQSVADWKIPKQTAIPAGSYDVIINMSARFKRRMPLLLSVPGFEGVRIHPGNTDGDTEGCILVGKTPLFNALLDSRTAFNALFAKLDAAITHESKMVRIQILPPVPLNTEATQPVEVMGES